MPSGAARRLRCRMSLDRRKDETMSRPLDSIRGLIETISDIGTAVRASREYSRLSTIEDARRAHRGAVSPLLPN